MKLGASAAAMALTPAGAHAVEPGADDVIAEFTGGAPIRDGGVEIDTAEIAENGYSVPVDISADGAEAILLVAPANPHPRVAVFRFGQLSATSSASTRIRLAATQDLVAVARMTDGSFAGTTRHVQVTVGGCSS